MRIKSVKIGFIGCILYLLIMDSFASETITVYRQYKAPTEAFILFYMASCPHCRRFNPILKKYALGHRIPVLAYTLDGKALPSFPKSVLPTQAEMNRFFPDGKPVVPALFLMDFNKGRIIPVLKGEANSDQLDRRLQQIQWAGMYHGN